MKEDGLAAWKAFLATPDAPQTAMSAIELEGYLAGLVVAPDLVPPSLWLSGIWGSEEPVFDSSMQAQAVLGSVMGRYNAVADRIDSRGARWRPLYFGPDGEPDVALSRRWATGFWKAMMVVRDAWLALADDARTRPLVEPFALLAELPEAEQLTPPPDIDERRHGYALDIPEILPALRKLAQLRAMSGNAPARRAPKTGRNDPCPCGSGRKYKRCCGAN